ncbi:hypothetical protein Daus18300_010814 [Diaporthe australafricana]|uniref:Protein kinase domain-containing protein n=1 Tax=Diaporthe australafricana TaxID=127596 RepID=A0ABR3W8U2_9PEZI
MPQSEAVVSSFPDHNESFTAGQETAQLNITAPIAIGAARGSQVVTVTVTRVVANGFDESFEAVAKIYDPLYYSFKSDLAHRPQDCVQAAENDYNNEVTAYEFLQSISQTGLFAPEYHGSWAFTLPITVRGQSSTRTIRMILIEPLKGTSILSTRVRNDHDKRKALDSFHYPEGYRLEVLAHAMDGYVRLLRKRLIQGDFAARNVMLVPQSADAPEDTVCGFIMPRIVLIDYNNARIIENMTLEETKRLPVNSARVFSGEYMWDDFPGWVPHEWENATLQQEWLMKRFTGPGRDELYLPVPPGDGVIASQETLRSPGPSATTGIGPHTESKASGEREPYIPVAVPPRTSFGIGRVDERGDTLFLAAGTFQRIRDKHKARLEEHENIKTEQIESTEGQKVASEQP